MSTRSEGSVEKGAVPAADVVDVPERRGFYGFYSRPWVQVFMIGLVCFMCPGMFNALSGIGGGGQVNADASDKGAVALYSTFAVFGFFGGTINNKLGSKLTLAIGSLGYSLYIGAFLSYNINANSAFVIAAGAILGCCAGLLWTAQGSLCLAYATESTKGRLFALFWIVFNLGAVIGSGIELGLTYNSTTNTVSNGVYTAFLILTIIGACIPALLVSPGKMIRSDGTRVVVPVHPSWKTEFYGLYAVLRKDYLVLLFFPYFLASNWFYTWQFNDYNGALFTLRTRALNSMLYWFFQIFGAMAFGSAVDSQKFRRPIRAWGALAFVLTLTMAVWGASYHYQLGYNRESVLDAATVRIDLKDSAYGGYVVLYIFMGILDAIWQNFAYWLMGAISNDAATLAYLVGLYKCIQSAGAAGVFRMDSNLVPYMTMLAVTWGLCIAGIVCLVPLIGLRIKNHTSQEDEKVAVAKEHFVEEHQL